MKRTPLRRTPFRSSPPDRSKVPLPRATAIKRSPMLRGKRKSSYALRTRDMDYMGWVKRLPCLLAYYSPCEGAVEADHAGPRALGRKAHDSTCIPLCTKHHRERTDYHGLFWGWDGHRMREWCDRAIAATQDRLLSMGVRSSVSARILVDGDGA